MIMPYTRSCTVTGLFASMNMRDSSVPTRRPASLGMTVWSMLIFFDFSASKTRYAVISLVSDAGSERSSGLPEASTWLLVASTSTHERAFTAGGGPCANAVLATSVAGSTTPRVTARLSAEGTKEATEGNDVRPEVEKRIGSIGAEKYIARRAQSLEEPVGERLAVKTARRPLDFRPRDRFAQHAL